LTEARSREIKEIVDQPAHLCAAADHGRGDFTERSYIDGLYELKQFSRRQNGMKWIPQIVSQNSNCKIGGFLNLLHESRSRLGKHLIDPFIEANQLQHCGIIDLR
jgi:hypothetical protein